MSHAAHHLHHIHHHGKKHLYAFKVKHNVWFLTLILLAVLALQINILFHFGMMPIQSASVEVPMSFAGTTLPVVIMDFLRSILPL